MQPTQKAARLISCVGKPIIMSQNIPRYSTGQSIHSGDLIKFSGEDGIVDFVITDQSPGWDSYWKELGQGIMLKVPSFGTVYVSFDDENLEFLSRSDNDN
jgi:hypothetical protein